MSASIPWSASMTAAVEAELRSAGCVYAEAEAALLLEAARTPAQLDALVARRAGGVPLEHLLGWVEFRGRRIGVEPGVFVPRRRTEFLAEQAVTAGRGIGDPLTVVELCCGCGAVGLDLLHELPGSRLWCVDLDPAAVRCARANLSATPATVLCGDLYTPLPGTLHGQVDVVVANAPYVPSDEVALMPREARDFEAGLALDGGADGLDVLRRVIAGAPRWLAPHGVVLVEAAGRQADALATAAAGGGLAAAVARCADRGALVVSARRRGGRTRAQTPTGSRADDAEISAPASGGPTTIER